MTHRAGSYHYVRHLRCHAHYVRIVQKIKVVRCEDPRKIQAASARSTAGPYFSAHADRTGITDWLMNVTSRCTTGVCEPLSSTGSMFIDLRDHYGITQVVADPDSPAFKTAETVRSEWVIRVDGKVATVGITDYDQSELGLESGDCYIIESDLFFLQYQFHKQKLLFHRATMKYYAGQLAQKGCHCHYIEAHDPNSAIPVLVKMLKTKGVQKIKLYDPCDNWIDRQLKKASNANGIALVYLPSPNFLNNLPEDVQLLGNKKTYFQTSFYTEQRKQRKILMEQDGSPIGRQWSFDAENRKKIPKNTMPTTLPWWPLTRKPEKF